MKSKLSICIMSTLINDKYKNQIRGCRETWSIDAEKEGIPVKYFCGNHKDNDFPFVTHLDNVIDDYLSATFKQYYGLQYLLNNDPADFYLVIGTDNYVNIDRILKMLEKYNPEHKLIIGGDGQYRNIYNCNSFFSFGGSGIILSHATLIKLSPLFDDFLISWDNETNKNEYKYLKPACDVSLYYLAQKNDIIVTFEPYMYPCTWIGDFYGTKFQSLQYNNIITCHFMEREDMNLYRKWINKGEYYNHIKKEYDIIRKNTSNINEHIPTLFEYAKKASRIIECCYYGDDAPTLSFILGLIHNLTTNKREIISTSFFNYSNDAIIQIAKEFDINVSYITCNSLEFNPKGEYDLIFIDTFHVYGQLKRELDFFSKCLQVNGTIIMHDTSIDAITSEAIRSNMDIESLMEIHKFTKHEIVTGIWPAITEFLDENKNFILEQKYENNNGLTIIRKQT